MTKAPIIKPNVDAALRSREPEIRGPWYNWLRRDSLRESCLRDLHLKAFTDTRTRSRGGGSSVEGSEKDFSGGLMGSGLRGPPSASPSPAG